MNQIWITILTTACTVLVSLTVTLLFNKISGLPKKFNKQKEEYKTRLSDLETCLNSVSSRITHVEAFIARLPEIQTRLNQTDTSLLELCESIKDELLGYKETLDERLLSLERREKNALRAKILDEYRLYTDITKNPAKAWSEMEHHSFFELVKDYESLGGNDYVHRTIIPAMNELDVIPMSDLPRLRDLYNSRSS